ncbi:MAG: DMT family transporter [Rhodobacteraceae bacterium]|nr:DMT family transporter [Paracoccaceae bacterium]
MQNLRGIALMVAAMAVFTIADICIKQVAGEIPIGQIMFTSGLGGVVIFGIALKLKGIPMFARDLYSPVIMSRNVGEVFGSFGIMYALTLIPLSSVASIMQAAPLVVTMGAALFLREKVGWRRWSAILTGFAGVLLVVRPGFDGFQPAALIAVIGVAGQALRDLSTRVASNRIPSLRIGFYGLLALSLLGLALMIVGTAPVIPSGNAAIWLVIFIFVGTLGYHMLNLALQNGDVAAIIPYRYSRILFGITAGVLIFDESVDHFTLIGAAIIVGSGLFVFKRERKRRNPA